jgi:hypothetical protein
MDLIATHNHGVHQSGVGGMAFDDETIRDEIGMSYTQTDLMTVKSVPAILLDNVGVRLKEVTTAKF